MHAAAAAAAEAAAIAIHNAIIHTKGVLSKSACQPRGYQGKLGAPRANRGSLRLHNQPQGLQVLDTRIHTHTRRHDRQKQKQYTKETNNGKKKTNICLFSFELFSFNYKARTIIN